MRLRSFTNLSAVSLLSLCLLACGGGESGSNLSGSTLSVNSADDAALMKDERSARRIKVAEGVFAAWSSGNADAPEKYFHPEGSLYDVVAGKKLEGWPAIRAFFAAEADPARNLTLIPERYWVSDEGVALSWVMSFTVLDDSFGAEHKGKRTRIMGMSNLTFNDNDLITSEVDYWSMTDIPRSLELTDGH